MKVETLPGLPLSGGGEEPSVETVLGRVPVSALGLTLMHEHLFVVSSDTVQYHPGRWGDDEANVASAVEALSKAHDCGVGSIVEMSVEGLGRRWKLVQAVAERVPVNIILATGIYAFDVLPFQYRFLALTGRDKLRAELCCALREDIAEGCHGGHARAQVLKCVIDGPGLTDDVVLISEAVASVQRETGVAVLTHSNALTGSGKDQAQLLLQLGVAPERIVIGHSDEAASYDYLLGLVALGVTVSFDRFGFEVEVPDATRLEMLRRLIEDGFAAQVVLSQDYSVHNSWIPKDIQSARCPNWSYTRVTDHVLPWLREAGVAEQTIRTMTVENPARLLARVLPSGDTSHH